MATYELLVRRYNPALPIWDETAVKPQPVSILNLITNLSVDAMMQFLYNGQYLTFKIIF
jgi:hypothetical protein